MPSPLDVSTIVLGDKRELTFITGMSYANSNNNTALFKNLATGNNQSFNNAQITVLDSATGTVKLTFTANEAGEFLAQFKASNNNATTGTVLQSPIFTFKVESPLA